MKEFSSDKGFTLIEIIVTLAIIGILTGMTTLVLLPQVEKSRRVKYIQEAETVYQGLELYLIDNAAGARTMQREVMMYPLRDSRNKIYGYLAGMCSEDARIARLSVDIKQLRIVSMTYKAGGYQVEVDYGVATECVKTGGT